jgi:hypothetical protein
MRTKSGKVPDPVDVEKRRLGYERRRGTGEEE